MARSPADPQDGTGFEQAVTEDIAGVQGDDGAESAAQPVEPAALGQVPDQPAPDGAEIEWAGGVVKKPPTPGER